MKKSKMISLIIIKIYKKLINKKTLKKKLKDGAKQE